MDNIANMNVMNNINTFKIIFVWNNAQKIMQYNKNQIFAIIHVIINHSLMINNLFKTYV